MTPDEAFSFYEEDEDPQMIFVKFDAGPKSVTARPTYDKLTPAGSASVYDQATGLFIELRRRAGPPVSAAGPRSYASARA